MTEQREPLSVNEQDAVRLLGPARMVLDRCGGCPDCGDEAAAMAQRIVDIIGHPVTDEPPHALVENDRLREAIALHRERIMSLGMGRDGHGTEWDRALWGVLDGTDSPPIFTEQADAFGGSVLSEHMETDRTSVSASERFDEAVELLHRLTSDEACRYDHNDFCQTHYDDRPCAHEEARAFLAEPEST